MRIGINQGAKVFVPEPISRPMRYSSDWPTYRKHCPFIEMLGKDIKVITLQHCIAMPDKVDTLLYFSQGHTLIYEARICTIQCSRFWVKQNLAPSCHELTFAMTRCGYCGATKNIDSN